MKEQILLILDMHGTALNTDAQMLEAIKEIINKYLPNQKFDNPATCVEWLVENKIVKDTKELLEISKQTVFANLIQKGLLQGVSLTADRLFKEYDTKLEEILLRDLQNETKKDQIIPAHFVQSISALQERGVILGFASNSSTAFLNKVLGAIGVKNSFNENAIIGSDKQAKDKTGAALAHALCKVNKPVTKLIFVGDAQSDKACLEGFRAKYPNINAEFIMMNLPGREINTNKKQELVGYTSFATANQKDRTCHGFFTLPEAIISGQIRSRL